VTAADYADQLKSLDSTMRNIEAVLDLDRLRKDKAELEKLGVAKIFTPGATTASIVDWVRTHVPTPVS